MLIKQGYPHLRLPQDLVGLVSGSEKRERV